MSEVFVTGIGMVTPLGRDTSATWRALCAGERGVRPVRGVDLAGCRTDFAGQVPDEGGSPESAGIDRGVRFATMAADEALRDAGLDVNALARLGDRAAVVVGSSKGSVLTFAALHERWIRRADNRLSLYRNGGGLGRFWQDVPPHAVAGAVARHVGAVGPRLCPVAACATGAVAAVQATRLVADADADVVVCGAADASIHPLWIAAFEQMDVLAPAHPIDGPAGACRPFDAERRGFAVSEGAAMLVLESQASVRARRARPLARVIGWALGSDPAGIATVDTSAAPLIAVIDAALARARVRPADVDLVNAHATGTAANDAAEAVAYARLDARRAVAGPVCISALKGALGHLLGAAGAVELAACVQTFRSGLIPPTANHTAPSEEGRSLGVVTRPCSVAPRHILKTSLGFGGHLAAIVLSAV